MIKIVFTIILSCAVINGVHSLPLEQLVPAHSARLRSSSEILIEAQLKNPSLKLLPNDGNLRQVVTGVMKELNPSVLVETLSLYNKPESGRSSSAHWEPGQKTGIYNQLTAISSLAGIQYYSASRDSMRTFFEASSVIDDPKTRNPLPDPVYSGQPPANLSIYARQKDLTFGDNIYQYSYTVNQNSIYFIQENVTALTYGIVPVIGKNNLKTILAVFDCGDSVLIYVASMAKASNVPGMGDRVSNSFSNRAEAVLSWFSNKMDIFFKTL